MQNKISVVTIEHYSILNSCRLKFRCGVTAVNAGSDVYYNLTPVLRE